MGLVVGPILWKIISGAGPGYGGSGSENIVDKVAPYILMFRLAVFAALSRTFLGVAASMPSQFTQPGPQRRSYCRPRFTFIIVCFKAFCMRLNGMLGLWLPEN